MRGGNKTIQKLPIDGITTPDQLKHKWEFMVLSGHGAIKPKSGEDFHFTHVPKDTYVIFNSPAGCRSSFIDGLPFSDLLIKDSDSDFYKDMLKEIQDRTGLMATFDKTTKENCFSNEIATGDNYAYSTLCSRLSEKQKSRAIYTPDTELPDMSITFNNNPGLNVMILGAYTLPISKRILTSFNTFPVRGPNIHRFNSAVFGNKTVGNKIPGVIGKSVWLSELFKMLPAIERGKKRLLFITSCRGVAGMDHPEDTLTVTKLLRRNSLGKRENATNNIVKSGADARAMFDLVWPEDEGDAPVASVAPAPVSVARAGAGNVLPSPACKACGKHGALMQCTRCHMARYCNKECQKADWKTHKGECEYMAAKRKAEEGNLIKYQ